jgi:hypothetical protein
VIGSKALAPLFNAIGPAPYADDYETNTVPNHSIIALLCLDMAVALLLIALGQGAGRHFEATLAEIYYWSGVVLLYLPFMSRIARPNIARSERLFLLFVLGLATFVYIRLYSPTRFYGFDEFIHWITAHDILHRHKMFLENTLLPVSPYYPAMEIASIGFSDLAAIDVFPGGWIVLALARSAFVMALFMFIERITNSSRVAAISCLVYMSASTFIVFDSLFSYESLGVVLVVLTMLAETRISDQAGARWLILPLAFLAVLAITHHASAMLCVSYLIAVVAIEAVRRNVSFSAGRFVMIAVTAVAGLAVVWSWESAPQNPVADYLSSAFMLQIKSFYYMLTGQIQANIPFESGNGEQAQSLLLRMTAMAGVFLICLCLATGFFRALTWGSHERGWQRLLSIVRRDWHDSRILVLTIGAFGYPISVLFRLSGGWEIGDRMATWVFISVGLVVAISITRYWEGLWWWRRSCTNFVIGTILLGGIIVGSGNHPIQGHYQVGADDASIEPMGIEAARWAKDWLGSGNNFAADRVNQLLLGTYGDQNIITNWNTQATRGADVRYVYFEKTINRSVLTTLKRGRIDYVQVDLRNTTNLPLLTMPDWPLGRPMSVAALLKYDNRPDVGRIFDNGHILIFNVGKLRSADNAQQ